MTPPKHFLELANISERELRTIITSGAAFKAGKGETNPLAGKTLAMIFEKPSTRTRVSFEVGMKQLGGEVVVLNQNDLQIGRGETIADTARVLSRYVDAIVLRTNHPDKLGELARNSTVPVINGLTDYSHPIQLLADILTYEEHVGSISQARVAWCGDGNNMALTWLQAAMVFGFELSIASPSELKLPDAEINRARGLGVKINVVEDPIEAVAGASCVVTDTWVSMGDKESERRHRLLGPYRVDEALMAHANRDAVFMHCLPAHRGEEVTSSVLDGPRSVVWDEAENRLHVQKGILMWCMSQ